MSDSLRPGPTAEDPIADATELVVEAWQEATPGKDPDATADDFERMRDGFDQLREQGPGTDTGR